MAGSNILVAAALSPKTLYCNRPTVNTALAAYTCPASSSAEIRSAIAANGTGSPVNLTVFHVPSGRSADATTTVYPAQPVPAASSLILSDLLGGLCLGPGDAIWIQTASANSIVVSITGIEST